jgi:hypothetical protein
LASLKRGARSLWSQRCASSGAMPTGPCAHAHAVKQAVLPLQLCEHTAIPGRVMSRPFQRHSSTDEVRLLSNITDVLAGLSQALLSPALPTPIKLAVSDVRRSGCRRFSAVRCTLLHRILTDIELCGPHTYDRSMCWCMPPATAHGRVRCVTCQHWKS